MQLNVLYTIARSSYGVVGSVMVGQAPTSLVVAPDGRRAYVPDVVTSTVTVVDLVHERVVANARVAYLPAGLAITPDGREVYVSNSDSSTISALDGVTDRLIGQAEAGARPRRIATTPDGLYVYVANWLGDTVSVIDARTISKIDDIVIGSSPYDVAMSPDGRTCYANLNGEGVAFIDTETNRVVAKLRYGPPGTSGALSDLSISPDGRWLYALDAQQGFEGVRVIDTHTVKLARSMSVAPIDSLSTWRCSLTARNCMYRRTSRSRSTSSTLRQAEFPKRLPCRSAPNTLKWHRSAGVCTSSWGRTRSACWTCVQSK
jgi:YVTN family beta-propeller protein